MCSAKRSSLVKSQKLQVCFTYVCQTCWSNEVPNPFRSVEFFIIFCTIDVLQNQLEREFWQIWKLEWNAEIFTFYSSIYDSRYENVYENVSCCVILSLWIKMIRAHQNKNIKPFIVVKSSSSFKPTSSPTSL